MSGTFKLPSFVLVTGNRGKLREAEQVLGFTPEHADIDLPEIQSLDLGEVLRAKAEEAWRRLERPLVVEETGLELDALGGFPGPLVKWMLQAIGPAGMARTAASLGNQAATARTALLYRDGHQTVIAEGAVAGRLVVEPRGDRGFGWDPVFVPAASDKTYAELREVEKERLGHRGRAWRALLKKLENLANPRA